MGTSELFKTAPEPVTRYFQTKTNRPSFDWRDVAPEEHAYAFTVAKSHGYEILDDIRSALDDAITNQVPFEQFRQRLKPILKEKGWWGRRFSKDPKDGATKLVQLGSDRRLRTIYWANTASAYAAGEWERIQRTKRMLPFLRYVISTADHKRPEHKVWVDIILPVDDPFWRTHYPPNGWLCKCRVFQITRREAIRRGWTEDTKAPEIVSKPWFNRRSGRWEDIPIGLDPGWHSNPGLNRGRNVVELLSHRVEKLTPSARRAAIADYVHSPVFARFVDRAHDTGLQHAAMVTELRDQGLNGADLYHELNRQAPYDFDRIPLGVVSPDLVNELPTVFLDARTIGHAADHRRQEERVWTEVQDVIDRGQVKQDGNALRIFDPQSQRFIVLVQDQPKGAWRIVTMFKGKKQRYFDKQKGERIR